MTRIALSILVAAVLTYAGASAWRSASPGAAATPKPKATGTPAPTATPLPPGMTALRIRIVNDGNRNGAADPGEPGVEGWYATLGCGDALFMAGPSDANGYTTATSLNGLRHDGVTSACVRVEQPIGWIPTGAYEKKVDVRDGEVAEVDVPFHYLGASVMELGFSVIRRGMPVSAVISLAAPYGQCQEAIRELQGLMLVVGGRDRAGCPEAGAQIAVLADGDPGGTVTFAPGTRERVYRTVVIGGDSMRFSLSWGGVEGDLQVTSATVDGVECAVIEVIRSFPVRLSVYVLSSEARAGCGTPGKLVQFYRDRAPLEPRVPWQAGWRSEPVEFTLAQTRVITPPNTGSAGLLPRARAD